MPGTRQAHTYREDLMIAIDTKTGRTIRLWGFKPGCRLWLKNKTPRITLDFDDAYEMDKFFGKPNYVSYRDD